MRTVLVLLIFVVNIAFGGFEQTGLSARARGLGGSYIGLADDAWAMLFNAGGLSQLAKQEISFLYLPGQFGLKELSCGAGAIAFPTEVGAIGFAGRTYGFELYREFTGTVSYATIFSSIGIGLSLNYHSVSIQGYGSAGTIGIDVGFLVPLLDQVRIGIAAKNLNAPAIGISKERLPQTFSAGIAYMPIEHTYILVDYDKALGFDPSPRMGIEYWIIDALALRGGMSDEPAQYCGGIGVKFSIFQLDYAYTSHNDLGSTHIGSITIRWGDGNE